jgi:hypothetical protein
VLDRKMITYSQSATCEEHLAESQPTFTMKHMPEPIFYDQTHDNPPFFTIKHMRFTMKHMGYSGTSPFAMCLIVRAE